jgi:hypothetical protein
MARWKPYSADVNWRGKRGTERHTQDGKDTAVTSPLEEASFVVVSG